MRSPIGEGARRGLESMLIVADRRGLPPPSREKGGSCLGSTGLTAELGGALGGERRAGSLGLAKELLRESLRKMPVPRSNVLSLAGMAPCGCAKRPAVALLARRAWAWTGGSPSSTSSKTGGGPNFLNGYVFWAPGGGLLGD